MQSHHHFKVPSYFTKRWVVFSIALTLVLLLYLFKDASTIIRVGSAFAFILAFYLADHLFDLRFSLLHYFFILFMAVTAFLLSPLYYIYPNYDKIQHFLLPLLYASIVFWIVRRTNSPRWMQLTFTFFIVVGTLAIFEVGEFLLDQLFNLQLQGVFLRNLQGFVKYKIIQDRNTDTMIDISLGILGSLLYVVIHAYKKRIGKF